ncbi:bifunctional 2-C-methyl-D-erythritol 4-phosphate cytidylyltransferase/2-C-methyl-D-erythritol 2,4-cyclodiphosphate synthase [uncultured Roseibium sp.]|uniref:bifunctional 2-C-methyl-D-erythritol 4-phosphate cytidylyltransferase/2-C-methyl-D-erythritol 2,4-cyclodiphosphate synthase n=1 Tax=uncultured Roseibium sp. TaxID=1936171 RepID=UPI002611C35D|nr:bifunctional 2-C-methyl-D-erythritol 4-phosphate cytidylyltransferase/2-C-methyl-D-erythritol 2,4-cyclodiphosphate synthase [uncultured Roseibium sp.]
MAKSAAALIVAAGRGTRLADATDARPKQYKLLANSPVLSHTLNALGNHPRITHIVTVIHPDDADLYSEAISAIEKPIKQKLCRAVLGGATRQKSVFEGLKALEELSCDYVLIHDAARPFVDTGIVDRLLQKLDQGVEGALAAVPVADTLKKAGQSDGSLETVDRTGLWAAQTPQGFPFNKILAAHKRAQVAGETAFTDDTGLAEWNGMTISLSDGDPANFKITTGADLERAEKQATYSKMTAETPALIPLSKLTDVRVGIGYDVHAFEAGEAVILGGVSIPYSKRLKGHSDADVALHAITDATLGAIGDGDIGQHFPPSDPEWKGASSDQFQQYAVRRLAVLGGRIAHIDLTIVCEEPKVGPHRDKVRASVARICELPLARVSVKATTSEKLGFTGRKEGIAALASVTVRLPFNDDE